MTPDESGWTPPANAPQVDPSTLPDLGDLMLAVTGANGFVGTRVCALASFAGAQVRALVRREGAAPAIDGVVEKVVDYADETSLQGSLAGVDVVVHCAAAAGPDHATAAEVNVDGTRRLVSAAEGLQVRRLVHVSTTSVVDRDAEVVDEQAPLVDDDAGPYPVTKRIGERVVADSSSRLETVVLRPPAVLGWGPTSTWGERVPAWVRDGEFPMDVDERDAIGWVHVDDLAAACLHAAIVQPAAGRTYVVAAGTTTFGEYLDDVVEIVGGDAPTPYTTADDPPAERRWVSDRARRELGWQPQVTYGQAMGEIRAAHT